MLVGGVGMNSTLPATATGNPDAGDGRRSRHATARELVPVSTPPRPKPAPDVKLDSLLRENPRDPGRVWGAASQLMRCRRIYAEPSALLDAMTGSEVGIPAYRTMLRARPATVDSSYVAQSNPRL